MASILIKSNKKSYRLEYNRSSIVRMEENGFNVSNIDTKPLSTITLLIRGAFYMHNPSLSDEEIDKIAEQVGDGQGFIQVLTQMYQDALTSLTSGKDDTTKNFKWEKA